MSSSNDEFGMQRSAVSEQRTREAVSSHYASASQHHLSSGFGFEPNADSLKEPRENE